jgi:hypothetical protein
MWVLDTRKMPGRVCFEQIVKLAEIVIDKPQRGENYDLQHD